jgi:predicted  nucleic acid-binding Zn-ribbon protein
MPERCDNCKTVYVSKDIKVETCTKCGKKISKPVKLSKALKNFFSHRQPKVGAKK